MRITTRAARESTNDYNQRDIISVEGYKAFRGVMLITPKNPQFPPREVEGDWLYMPEGYWYCKGSSYPASICQIQRICHIED